MSSWDDLFSYCKFISKPVSTLPSINFSYPKEVDNYHPKRKLEYLIGRQCAIEAHELLTGETLHELLALESRSPNWPVGVVGSISHSDHLVGAAVGFSTDLYGVGIDFEEHGRVKLEMASHLTTDDDLKHHASFSQRELLTIIFSAKESLYKALHPEVKTYFGFEKASLVELDQKNERFVIDLLVELKSENGKIFKGKFVGKFRVSGQNCLTVIEIPR